MSRRLALGLDLSTQSITSVLIDIGGRVVVCEKSLDYLADPRLSAFGLNKDYLLPPSEPGEANQPVAMFLAALDAVMADLSAKAPVSDIAVVNFSVQQHGHVYLNERAGASFGTLREPGASGRGELQDVLLNGFAMEAVKTWRTASTARQADFVRRRVGGREPLIKLSGSDAPLRFSAFSMRKTAQDLSEVYGATVVIHQLNTLLAAAMTGDVSVPLDHGNACGLSLMDYRRREWSEELVAAVSDGLPGGAEALRAKLPTLASGMTMAGPVCAYFTQKYGFDRRCLVGVGSGDNSQSKVLSPGTTLSLGSSLVLMAQFDGETFDLSGNSNAMYDPFGRPYMFGCRTNGALRWDEIRAMHGHGRKEFAAAEAALEQVPPGNTDTFFLWQAETESFPRSASFQPVRIGYSGPDFARDYAGLVDSTLGITYLYSRGFTGEGAEMVVTGGAAASAGILRRIAAIWNRTVIPVSGGGAALGAAISGACALLGHEGGQPDPGEFALSFVKRGTPVAPRDAEAAAYHDKDGYLQTLQESYERLISKPD